MEFCYLKRDMSEYYPVPQGNCEVCRKPFEYRVNPSWESVKHLARLNPSKLYWLPVEHPECLSSLEAREKDERKSAQRLETDAETRRLLRELGFPQILADKPFEKFHPEPGNRAALEALQRWAPNKTGVLLYGPPGRGKTHLMAAFGKRWADAGMTVGYNTMSGLLALLRRGFDEDVFSQRLRLVSGRVPLLLLDDLGVEKATEWTTEILYTIVNTRLESGLPLFVTTNCTEAELEKKFHSRIVSRLKEMCTWIEVGGRDWRAEMNQARTQNSGFSQNRPPGKPPGHSRN
jgi:DNA replication protein DnaC